MPSKPPPLPPSFTLSAPDGSVPASNRINWSAVLASTSVGFALIVTVVAWIVTHPHKAPASVESPSVAAVAPVIQSPAPVPTAPPPPPAPRLEPVIETTPALHRPDRLARIPSSAALVEESPPPLPPPPPEPQPRGQEPQAAPQPAGETYGTQVLFLHNQEAAADQARREHKLLFVMHISGNFEDSCFT